MNDLKKAWLHLNYSVIIFLDESKLCIPIKCLEPTPPAAPIKLRLITTSGRASGNGLKSEL